MLKYDIATIYNLWIKHNKNASEVSRLYGIGETTIRRYVAKANLHDIKSVVPELEISVLKSRIKKLEEDRLTDEYVKKEIFKIANTKIKPAEWKSKSNKKKRIRYLAGIPTFFASDWHYGEVVKASEIGYLNEYDTRIASERANKFIETGIELLKKYMPLSVYDGCVLAIGGDMISGDIHEELTSTNEKESIESVLELCELLTSAINRLVEEFGNVLIPCVTGNHGRMTKKPRMKRRNHTNFDWLLYNMLAKHFKHNSKVSFMIPDGADVYYKIYNTRYLLTHGDQFRGGDGMIGAIGPIFRGDKKKRARNAETKYSYDVICMGHWHQYIHLTQLIVNGSLKGYDEYAYANNLGFELAQQALWVTHPEHGITYRMPVFLQTKPDKQ